MTGESAHLEACWLGLRTDAGLPVDAVASASARGLVAVWRKKGWAVEDADRIRLTAQGWLLLDELAVELSRVTGSTGSVG